MENTQQKVWSILIKVLIAIGSALLGAMGGAEATALLNS
jgi:hypothetical protein